MTRLCWVAFSLIGQRHDNLRCVTFEVLRSVCKLQKLRLNFQGDVIYVDFGQRLNFATLAKDYNVSFAGKIALARLGGCSVRNKVTNAAQAPLWK